MDCHSIHRLRQHSKLLQATETSQRVLLWFWPTSTCIYSFFQSKHVPYSLNTVVLNLPFLVPGLAITSDVLIGKSTWDALFQPPNFFSKYKYLISCCFLCLFVKLSICRTGLYNLNVHLRTDAIKVECSSVLFDYLPVLVDNALAILQYRYKKEELFLWFSFKTIKFYLFVMCIQDDQKHLLPNG